MQPDVACEGWVVHRRLQPVRHEFRYPVWMLCADLDRLRRSERGLRFSPWLSVGRRPAPLRLPAEDFIASDGSVLAGVNGRLAARGLPPAEQVLVLTQPRSWGMYFNPVNFYLCYADGRLAFVLADINNTPWDEHFTYILDARGQHGELSFRFPKSFHVSPFMPMDLEYQWRLRLQGDVLEIAMRLTREDQEQFFAGLYLKPRPLDRAALRRGALAYPLQNARTLARIYWQALRLFLKRVPFFPHPQRTEEVGTT